MTRRLQELRARLQSDDPARLAVRAEAGWHAGRICLAYWGQEHAVSWPTLQAVRLAGGQPCSTFDAAMLLYYLATADGTLPAGRWIGFRELPGGSFYNQAFQGYSGDPLARTFSSRPGELERAAQELGGRRLTGIAPFAWSFLPLPRLSLAAALWPGDEELAGRAAVLFDASASHYLPTDGLALLGAGLSGRLLRLAGAG
jgi:hypothetical protein